MLLVSPYGTVGDPEAAWHNYRGILDTLLILLCAHWTCTQFVRIFLMADCSLRVILRSDHSDRIAESSSMPSSCLTRLLPLADPGLLHSRRHLVLH